MPAPGYALIAFQATKNCPWALRLESVFPPVTVPRAVARSIVHDFFRF